MFVPGVYEQETELLPEVKWTEIDAAEWFSGLHDGSNPAPGTDLYQYRQNMKRLRNARLLRGLRKRRKDLLRDLGELGDSADDRVNFRRWSDDLSRVESDIERYRAEGESG